MKQRKVWADRRGRGLSQEFPLVKAKLSGLSVQGPVKVRSTDMTPRTRPSFSTTSTPMYQLVCMMSIVGTIAFFSISVCIVYANEQTQHKLKIIHVDFFDFQRSVEAKSNSIRIHEKRDSERESEENVLGCWVVVVAYF